MNNIDKLLSYFYYGDDVKEIDFSKLEKQLPLMIKKELEKIDDEEILLFIESMVIGYNDINKKSS